MKSIKLQQYVQPHDHGYYIKDKMYAVPLGNGRTYYFNNKNKLNAFLIKASKYLTFKMHECNKVFTELNTLYRSNWFIINDTTLYLDAFADIEKNMGLLIKRTLTINGNHFVFSWFRSIINNLHLVCVELHKLFVRYNKHAECYFLDSIYIDIVNLKEDLFNWNLPEKLERVKENPFERYEPELKQIIVS